MTDLRAIPSADLVAAADTARNNAESHGIAVEVYVDQMVRWDAAAIVSMATGRASHDTERIEQAGWQARQADADVKLAQEAIFKMALASVLEAACRLELSRRRDMGVVA